jgi:serine/threonine protein kinase/predicted Zn-dependent protease
MNKLGKYDLLERIGAGGYGVVFKGYDPFIKRTVAIKTCSSDDERIRLRFYREAEIAGNLIHPNITTIYDFGIHDDVPYLVEEFLTGEDLDHKIKRRAEIPVSQRLDYLVQVARGLEYAHAQGVVHRDIKPGNIRVLDNDRAKIMDFGTAKLANVDSQLTQAGMTLGTAAYISPEQIQGSNVGLAADIFSFGVTAYELLAYVRPFDGRKIATVLHQILNEPPRPVHELWPDCPPDVAAFLERCLQKDPSRRFAGASELLADLQEVVQAYVRSRRTTVDPIAEAKTLFLDSSGAHPVPATSGGLKLPPIPVPRTPSGQIVTPPPSAGTAPTASPSPTSPQLPPLPPVPTTDEPRTTEVTDANALLERARQLHEGRELARAVLAASAAVAAAPGDEQAHLLLRTVEEDLRAEVERERRKQAVATRVQQITGLLDRQDLTTAGRTLADAEAELGGAESGVFLNLRFRLGEQIQQRRAEASAAALAKAETQMDRNQYRAAKATLQEALAADPENEDLQLGLTAADRLLSRHAGQTGAAQQDAVASIETLIDRGRLDEATQALAFAAQMLGDFPDLDRLRQRVVERTALQALRKELAQRVEGAAACAQRQDYASALALLAEVEQEDPSYPGLTALKTATRQALQAQDEARRRLQGLAEATALIEGHVRRGELERAEQALAFAVEHLAPFDSADRLHTLIAEERVRLQQVSDEATRQGLHNRLRRAQQLLTNGEFGAAIRLLRQLLEDNPESDEIDAMLREAKEAQGRAAESQRREDAVAEAATSVEVHLAAGDHEAARQSLEFAVELLGPTSELVTLRKRINQAELSSTAVRRRSQALPTMAPSPSPPPAPVREVTEVDSLLAISRELLRLGQVAAAQRTLQAALSLDPENREGLDLLAGLPPA